MMERSKTVYAMDKVKKKYYYLFLKKSITFFSFEGKLFFPDGKRYEGEFKDGKYHGQG